MTATSRTKAVTLLRHALDQAIVDVRAVTGHEPTVDHLVAFRATDPDVPALRAELRETRSFLLVEAPRAGSEAIERIEAALKAARLPLACPDCGQPVEATMGFEGGGYLAERVVTGFECSDYRCGAEWEPDGSLLVHPPVVW